jgi:quercetin dioxygenase-like cupin family protein
MRVFSLTDEAEFNPKKHVEKILGRVEEGDVTVACWEPGQISPYHCHPHATEIYFCFEGGGVMRTPRETVAVKPGAFVVHPPGEVHEYANGPGRTLLFRVRYGYERPPFRMARPRRLDAKRRGRRILSPASAVMGAKGRKRGERCSKNRIVR